MEADSRIKKGFTIYSIVFVSIFLILVIASWVLIEAVFHFFAIRKTNVIVEGIIIVIVLFNYSVIPFVRYRICRIMLGSISILLFGSSCGHLWMWLILIVLMVSVMIFFPWKEKKKARLQTFAYIIVSALIFVSFAVSLLVFSGHPFQNEKVQYKYGPGEFGIMTCDVYDGGERICSYLYILNGKVYKTFFVDYCENKPVLFIENKGKDLSINWRDDKRVVLNDIEIDLDEEYLNPHYTHFY